MKTETRRCTLRLAVLGGLALALAPPVSAQHDPAQVWVSILPQEFIVDRIGGNLVETRVLVGPGLSPATFEPTPQQMARLQQAQLLIRIGVPFEDRLLPRLQSIVPELRVVDGHRGIDLVHADGHHGHDHGGVDPHFWLDPVLMRIHARTTCAALCELDPENCDVFRENTEVLQRSLDDVHRELSQLLAPWAGKKIFAFHPSYGYLARRYGLQAVAAESEGKEPGPRELARLIEDAEKAGVRTIFVQPQFSARTANALAEAIHGEVVNLDPLAADYLNNLEYMGKAIHAALSEARTGEPR